MRVVEDVEKFETEIESEILMNDGPLRDSEIGVVEPRTVEEAPICGAERSQIGVLNECAAGWDARVQIRVKVRSRR